MSVQEKVNQLASVIEDLKDQAIKANKPVNKIIKIGGADNIVLQLNAVPNGNDARVSLTLHRRNNYRKQIGIIASDYTSLMAIAKFLQNYADVLNEYIKFNITTQNNAVVEFDDNNNQNTEPMQKQTTRQTTQTTSQPQQRGRRQARNVEAEF